MSVISIWRVCYHNIHFPEPLSCSRSVIKKIKKNQIPRHMSNNLLERFAEALSKAWRGENLKTNEYVETGGGTGLPSATEGALSASWVRLIPLLFCLAHLTPNVNR
jgi:hypothetical protein